MNAMQNILKEHAGPCAQTRATVHVIWAPKRLMSEQHLHGRIDLFHMASGRQNACSANIIATNHSWYGSVGVASRQVLFAHAFDKPE